MALSFGKGKKGEQDANAAPGGAEALDESWFEEAFDAEAVPADSTDFAQPVSAAESDFSQPMEDAVEDDFSAFAALDDSPVAASVAASAPAAFDMDDFAPDEEEVYAPDLSDLPPIPTGKAGKKGKVKPAKAPKVKGDGGGKGKKLIPVFVFLLIGGGGGYFWYSQQQHGGDDGTDLSEAPPVMPVHKKPDAAKPDAAKPSATKPDAHKPTAAKPDAAKPAAVKPEPPKPAATPAKPKTAATGQAPIVDVGTPDKPGTTEPSAAPTHESPFKSKIGKLWAEGIVHFHKGEKDGARKKWEAAVKLAKTKPEGADSAAAIQEAIDNKLK